METAKYPHINQLDNAFGGFQNLNGRSCAA